MTKLPVTGAFTVTAIYGQRGTYWKNGHKGIDLIAQNRQIFSTCCGTVRKVGYDAAGWGNFVSIDGDEGYRHIFCHLKEGSITVKAGDKVTPTIVIGTMGATGNVTGVHLHYQLQIGSTVVDPTIYLGIPNKTGTYHTKDYQEGEQGMAYRDEKIIPAWAKSAVEQVTEKGWMKGDDNGDFRPNDPITRAELAVVLSRL